MTSIEATYRVVTPLFCAGADPNRPELRLASFKGVLRFWWRALAWSRLDGDLDCIRQQEDRLFGSAGGGQSRVSMRLEPAADPATVAEGEVLRFSSGGKVSGGKVAGEGARYLGYGVMEAFVSRKKGTQAGQLIRACVCAPFDFTVRMRARDVSEEALAGLKDALIALGVLGGMGARSRKGYGSIAIRSLSVDGEQRLSAPQTMDGLRAAIATLQPRGGGSALPEFTALSPLARHVLLAGESPDPLELLDLVGCELVRYRSWGHNGRILDGRVESERNFQDDHDLMNGDRGRAHPRRIAFGLPHNYGPGPDKQVDPHDRDLDRRASPLFIHLHECGGAPVAVLSLLPAQFLPKGRSAISVGRSRVSQRPERELYRPIHDFLDRVLDPRKREEPFTRAVEVCP